MVQLPVFMAGSDNGLGMYRGFLMGNKTEGEEKEMNVDDKVQYSTKFLRSIGMYTGNLPRAKGTIQAITDLGSVKLAEMKWDYPDIPVRVNIKNLCKIK